MIPEVAVEAAKLAIWNAPLGALTSEPERESFARAALEAAAPHMLAGAWRAGFWKGTEWVESAGEDGSEDARFNNPHDGSKP